MKRGIRDTLYQLLESAEPSADYTENLRKLEEGLEDLTNKIYRVTKQLASVRDMKEDWEMEQEGMSLLVDLIADKYGGFDEENLDELEDEDASILRHIFSVKVKKLDRDLEVQTMIWNRLLVEYKEKEIIAIDEVEKFKVTLEDEIAQSFMDKWEAFVVARKQAKAGNYD